MAAIIAFNNHHDWDKNIDFLDDERELFIKRFSEFKFDGKDLLFSGGVVPTMEQVQRELDKVHYKFDRHRREKRYLRKALMNAGFRMPSYLGGLTRVVDE